MGSPACSVFDGVFRRFSNLVRILPLVFGVCILCASVSEAQTIQKRQLVTAAVDENNLTVLRGNTYPLARADFDRGAAPPSLALHRMLLVLKRSPELESGLEALLAQQQDKSSPSYHHWLTAAEFGQQFGPGDEDIQAITSWLQSHGFEVAKVSNGRTVIEFSGTAAQVADAFHTEIHKYSVNGEDHLANASDPQIPSALVPVVIGVRSLHNFFAKPMNQFAGTFHRDQDSGRILPTKPLAIPQYTPGSGFKCGILGGPCEAVGPYDLATIYNVLPLWNETSPIDGTGQTIAIVGETDINPLDWTAFWNMFGVTTPKGTLNVIHNGPDPGILQNGEEAESDIDTQWSSAVAKGATIDFVVSESTETTQGIDLSAEYIVDNNLAPVMSESYGACELFIGTAGNAYFNAIWQQASAQGITVFLSSGDQGSAVCDRDQPYAVNGLAVSGFASTPYNVAVGGTDFNDLQTTATYWNPTNNANEANAKGHIPEMTWNETCTNSEIFPFLGTTTAEQACNNITAQNDGFVNVTGGSGGASSCTVSDGRSPASCSGGYAKPPWQVGTGVPADGKRDVPDVSLFASSGFNNSFYIICESDQTGACSLTVGDFLGFGGTSVSSPAFAGVMALVNQKTGERQGNANYVFYKMAAGAGNSCNSNTVPITGPNNCIFYDVPVGSTIAMPCHAATPNCVLTSGADTFGVLTTSGGIPGYNTTTGYDLATGLGSVNVTNLVNQWSTFSGQFRATTVNPFTLGPPTTITHGQPVPVTATVKPQSGTGTPTGTITLIANAGSAPSGEQAAQQILTLSNGSIPAGTTTTVLPGGTNYSVTAHYAGDGTFAPSDSAPFSMTVNPEASKVQIAYELFNPATGQQTNPNATVAQYGSLAILRTNVTSQSGDTCAQNAPRQSGCPTGSVNITNNEAALDAGTYQLNSLGYTEDQTVLLPGGTSNLKAIYSGDNSFIPNTGTETIMITKAPTTTAMTNPGNQLFGQPVILNATISSTGFGAGPTGQVTFFSGATQLGSPVPLTNSISGSFNVNPQAQAALTTMQLPFGNNSITAQYSADTNYGASTSSPVTFDVQIQTNCGVTSSNPTINHGSSVTFTYNVVPGRAGGPAPTGSVVFTGNSVTLGTVPLANGQAQLTTSSLPGGNITILTSYPGDANYVFCDSGIGETVLLLPTTTTVNSSNPAIQQGQSVTLSAHVAPVQAGGPALTGTVQFFSSFSLTGGDTPLGSAPLSNGQAQITTTALPTNTQFVFAGYSGDSNYANSTGSAAQTVTPAPDFSVAANPTTIVISAPGAGGSTTLTFTAMNGLSGTFNLVPQCSGLPSESSCSVSSPSITLNSGTPTASVMLTIATKPRSSSFAPGIFNRPAGTRILIAFTLLAVLGTIILFSHRRRIQLAMSILAFATLLTVASCGGGGGGGGSGGGGGDPGTPVGLDPNASVSFTLGSASHALPFSVNVQ